MTTPTEIIARADLQARQILPPKRERLLWDQMSVLARIAAFAQAKALVQNLRDAGYAIVPVAPTDEMLELGMLEAEACTDDFTTRASCLPGHVWGAMIRASGKES